MGGFVAMLVDDDPSAGAGGKQTSLRSADQVLGAPDRAGPADIYRVIVTVRVAGEPAPGIEALGA
jgi:hypothetical protein